MKKLILPFILLNMIGGTASVLTFAFLDNHAVWLGVAMAMLPLPFFLIVVTNIFKLARSSARLPLIQLISLTGLITVGYNFDSSQGAHHLVAGALAIIGFSFVQWFVWSFSTYKRQGSDKLSRGSMLPAIKLKSLDEKSIDSSTFSGAKTLLVFFRANWCPFCMNQLAEVIAKAEHLKKLGVNVKFISNQGIEHSLKLKSKLKLPAHFEILQDDDLSAAKTLKIADLGGTPLGMKDFPVDTVMATVIAIDEDGKILFGDETDNYRVRPHPDVFIPVFE